jgi:flagellar hook protein FlgE
MSQTTLFGTPAPASPSITIGASSTTAPAAGQVNWATSLGVSGQTIAMNLSATNGNAGVTQLSGASNAQVTTNGTTFGSLSSVAVGATGIVTATFSNGTSRNIAQIAMATFPNENGLEQVDGNAYQTTAQSGAYSLEAAGSGGAGKIASSSLEGSTVDLSTQFTDLITTQSAYSAASKVITTADNMTQALLQIIQG